MMDITLCCTKQKEVSQHEFTQLRNLFEGYSNLHQITIHCYVAPGCSSRENLQKNPMQYSGYTFPCISTASFSSIA